MLRAEVHDSANTSIVRVEGRLTKDTAELLRTLATRCKTGTQLVVNLTELMFVDAIGEDVLSFFKRLGAEFVAETSYSLDVCERLSLPLARKGLGPPTDMVISRR
jgi:hypothetical protein